MIRDRWVKDVKRENIITDCRYGFRVGRSCVTNLLSFYSRMIHAVDQREGWNDYIYLDSLKVFEKVSWQRFL